MKTLLIHIRNLCVIYVTVFCELSCNPDVLSSILHIRLYVPIDCVHDMFHWYFSFFPNVFSNENHLRYHVIYVTKKIPIGVLKAFFDLGLNKLLSKQSWHRRFKGHCTHYYVSVMLFLRMNEITYF